jgi:sugar transferase (PEP-CTERM/EpsH1 system associated)
MKILLLAHRLPFPPTTGDKIRAYHIAHHLAKHHSVTLGALADEADFVSSANQLRRTLGDVEVQGISRRWKRLAALGALIVGGSATMSYFSCGRLKRCLKRRLQAERYDLLYISSSSMAQYAESAPDVPAVVDFVDVDSDKWVQYGRQLGFPRGWIYSLEGRRLQWYEREAGRRAARAVVATEVEATLLRELLPSRAISVVPNGVDLTYFTPAAGSRDRPVIVFTGAMDYYPNVDAVAWFCGAILPTIRSAVPEVRFVIVGKDPTPAVMRLTGIPGVQVTGTVADVRPFLSQAALAVAPLRIARGVQNKVLEAMAAGLPVVATPKAHEGISAVAGRDLFVAREPSAFAEQIVALLRNAALRAEVGLRARHFVETNCSWEATYRRLDQLIASILPGA